MTHHFALLRQRSVRLRPRHAPLRQHSVPRIPFQSFEEDFT